MLFSNLMCLPHDQAENIDLAVIRAAVPATPLDVGKQVYAEHGRKLDFQATYGHIDISNITWKLVAQPASSIVAANVMKDSAPVLHFLEGDRWMTWMTTNSQSWTCPSTRKVLSATAEGGF
jgi:hypothetical protein